MISTYHAKTIHQPFQYLDGLQNYFKSISLSYRLCLKVFQSSLILLKLCLMLSNTNVTRNTNQVFKYSIYIIQVSHMYKYTIQFPKISKLIIQGVPGSGNFPLSVSFEPSFVHMIIPGRSRSAISVSPRLS